MGASTTGRAWLASQDFARECYEASRALRRAPAEVKRATKARVRDEVAEPLARKIAAAASGPYARVLSPAVKTTPDLTPRIKIGGARKVVSGGARVRDLMYGAEWAGGSRVSTVRRERVAGRRRRGRVSAAERARAQAAGAVIYKRRTTRQFRRAHPFIYSTIRRERPALLEAYADVVTDALEEVLRG